MANTRENMLKALATELTALDEIALATNFIPDMEASEKVRSYVGIVAGEEDNIIEDGTHICYELPVLLFIIVEQKYFELEPTIVVVKNAIYNSAEALTLTNNVQKVVILATQPVELENYDANHYASVQMDLMIRYFVTKTDI